MTFQFIKEHAKILVKEEKRPLYELFSTIEFFNIIISMFLNTLLIYLIITKSSKDFGSYKYLLLAFAINDIMFPIVNYLTLPVMCTYKDAFLMFSTGIWASKVSICFFASVFSQAMPLLGNLFIYRLIATTRPALLSFYTKKRTCIIVASTVLIENALWFSNCYINQDSDDETRAYVQPFLDEEFGGKGEGHIASYYYNEKGLRVQAFVGTMILNGIMVFWLSIILFCTVEIIRSFSSRNCEWSEKTRRLQKGMMRTLLIQTVIPFLTVYFTCAFALNTAIFGIRIESFPNQASVSHSFFPLADALVVIFGIKSYRRGILCCVNARPWTTSTAASVNQNSIVKKI